MSQRLEAISQTLTGRHGRLDRPFSANPKITHDVNFEFGIHS